MRNHSSVAAEPTFPPARRLLVRRVRDLLRVTLADHWGGDARLRISGEAELMTEYAAPRDAVREALALLADEGLIERRRGLGTLRLGDSVEVNIKLPTGETPLLRQFGARDRLQARLLEWTWTAAPDAVAARLADVSPGDDCLCIDYVLRRNDQPICVITNYLRRHEAASLAPTDFLGDFFSLLSHTGTAVRAQDVVLQPRLADEEVALLLDVAPGAPLMWMEQVIRDEHGDAIDFAIVHIHGDLRVGIPDVPRMELASSAIPRQEPR